MTRPRPTPSIATIVQKLAGRVAFLERSGRDVIRPISTAATTINQTAPQTPFLALVNPLGASMTWWVYVTPTAGTTTSLQLRGEDGAVGDVVTAPSGAPSTVGVSLTCPPDWQPGQQKMIFLDAWINVNSATVVPVSARFT